jgi:hypothetical protein
LRYLQWHFLVETYRQRRNFVNVSGSPEHNFASQQKRVLNVIKSVVLPKLVPRQEELDHVRAFLTELGFRVGEGWDDERSRGVPLLAPVGALEFYHGQPPAPADVIVEVADVDLARQTAERHGIRVLSDVCRTHWGSDLFVANVSGCHIAFFAWAEAKEAPLPDAA